MCSENHLHFDYVRLAWDAGFCFEEYNTKNTFDISTLGLVDIEKVTRDRDIATVERHIPTILQFRLDEELAKILEPTFVKLFKLCQLSLQYLRFCNKYLDNTVIILKKDLSARIDENSHLSSTVEQFKTEMSNLSIKHKELKEAFQNINQTVSFWCHECPKMFATEEYLQAHLNRKHDSQSAESEKLQLEIKELKERLNSTEKYIQSEKQVEKEPNNDDVFEDKEAVLQAKFEQLKEHIEKELSVLRDESFYRNIYEKWFEEIFHKLKYEAPKKVFVEQGCGDCAQLIESSTQTNVAEEEHVAPTPRGILSVDEKTAESVNIEQRMKNETDVQRDMLEQIFEEKIVGSLGKLETQMSSFGKKLDDLELKQLESTTKQILISKEIDKAEETKRTPTPTKINSTTRKSRYIDAKRTVNYVHSSEENESENDESGNESITSGVRKLETRDETLMTVAQKYKSRGENIIPVAPKNIIVPPKAEQKRIESKSVPKEQIRVGSLNNKINHDQGLTRVASDNDVKSNESDESSVSDDSDFRAQKREKKTNKEVLHGHVQRSKRKVSDETVKLPTLDESSERRNDGNGSEVRSASTPAVRSITSLKSARYDHELCDGLKEELEDILHLRLTEIGVAPQRNGLPDKNFKHATSVIEHQALLSSKAIPNYFKIRDEISRAIDKALKKNDSELKQEGTLKNRPRKRSCEEKTAATDVNTEAVTIFENSMDLSSSDGHSYSENEVNRQRGSTSKPVTKSGAGKKKVLFDLDNDCDAPVQIVKATRRNFVGGSTSFAGSSFHQNDEDTNVRKDDTSENKEESDDH